MDSSINSGMQRLHQLHQQLREASESLERGPRQLKARQQSTAARQAELEAQRTAAKQLRVAADGKSLQHKSNEAKIESLRVKLNQAASNREFDALKTQIAADTMANSVLEGEFIELLEKVDQAQAAIKKLEADVAASIVEEERFAAKTAEVEPGLKAIVESLRKEIATAEQILPAEPSAVYRRLVAAHGDGAMAPVEDGICSHCYVRLSPQGSIALKAGKITFCTCGRLLYWVQS